MVDLNLAWSSPDWPAVEAAIIERWLKGYREWLAAGVCHEITVEGVWTDPTETRRAYERADGADSWQDYMEDYFDQCRPQWQGWRTNGLLLYGELWAAWRELLTGYAREQLGLSGAAALPADVAADIEEQLAASLPEDAYPEIQAEAIRVEVCQAQACP